MGEGMDNRLNQANPAQIQSMRSSVKRLTDQAFSSITDSCLSGGI